MYTFISGNPSASSNSGDDASANENAKMKLITPQERLKNLHIEPHPDHSEDDDQGIFMKSAPSKPSAKVYPKPRSIFGHERNVLTFMVSNDANSRHSTPKKEVIEDIKQPLNVKQHTEKKNEPQTKEPPPIPKPFGMSKFIPPAQLRTQSQDQMDMLSLMLATEYSSKYDRNTEKNVLTSTNPKEMIPLSIEDHKPSKKTKAQTGEPASEVTKQTSRKKNLISSGSDKFVHIVNEEGTSPKNKSNRDLDFNMSAAEMKAKLSSKKKPDPRKEIVDSTQKHLIYKNM